ncbi:MAG TPA: septum site-determining protein MinC [Bacillota bacterium]|nr:septum site-determining protein MinC [Bacillota bacterium]
MSLPAGQEESAPRPVAEGAAAEPMTPPAELPELHDLLLSDESSIGEPARQLREQPTPLMLEGGPLRSDRIPAGERTDGDTLLVRKTLRSGQHVGHRGNVVVLGDVNPGAEVVAAGDILVLGALRGVAHAGARGDEQALVAGFRLRPTQLRIGTHIARAPDGDITGPEQPEVALVKEGRVVIRPYCPAGRMHPRRLREGELTHG